jgi:hypothetical protein
VVTASEVSAVLELPPNNLQILLDTLAAIYPHLVEVDIDNVPGTMVPVHCLCLFLLAQLYGKRRRWRLPASPEPPPGRMLCHTGCLVRAGDAQGLKRWAWLGPGSWLPLLSCPAAAAGKEQHRPEAMDHWPEAAPVPSSPESGSPTRAGSRSPTGARGAVCWGAAWRGVAWLVGRRACGRVRGLQALSEPVGPPCAGPRGSVRPIERAEAPLRVAPRGAPRGRVAPRGAATLGPR